MNQALFSYIDACPTAYHTVAHSAKLLQKAGFSPLSEGAQWQLVAGGKYYVTRGGSSLIAFTLPHAAPSGCMLAAAHTDSPAFKIKWNEELSDEAYVRLSTEKYGGMLCASWLDRPLGVAGRVLCATETGVESRLVRLPCPAAIIPSVAIHMNREANTGMNYNAAVDMIPLWGGEKGSFRTIIAKAADVKEDCITGHDLFLYNPQPAVAWGAYISAPRLDDLQCAFSVLQSFIVAKPHSTVNLCCLFDNEEVGSETAQGAASGFLGDVLARLCRAMGWEVPTLLHSSMLLSCDNAHARHPNHGEYADKNHAPILNGGVVIKHNANRRYATDGLSSSLFSAICKKAVVTVQHYANRADLAGGSTLGSIAATRVPLLTADIGLPQLAMHSAFETAGAKDTAQLVAALTAFYETTLHRTQDCTYTIE